MKKTILLLSLLVVLSFSCDKKYKFYAFYIEKTVDVEFPAGSAGDFDTIQEVNLYIDNILEKEGTDIDLIEEITIEEINLANANFNKFNNLDLFISTESLTEIQLASSEIINVRDNSVLLNVTEEKMDDYVKASIFNIKTVGQLSTSYAQAFTVPINLRFLITDRKRNI